MRISREAVKKSTLSLLKLGVRLDNLGRLYLDMNKLSLAEDSLKEAIDTLEQCLPQGRQEILFCIDNLIRLHRANERPEEEEKHLIDRAKHLRDAVEDRVYRDEGARRDEPGPLMQQPEALIQAAVLDSHTPRAFQEGTDKVLAHLLFRVRLPASCGSKRSHHHSWHIKVDLRQRATFIHVLFFLSSRG